MERLFIKSYRWLNSLFEKRLARAIPSPITPNMITVFRTLLAVPIVFLIFYGFMAAGMTMFVFSGVLDYVDGALARGRNEVSELGKFLDPISDKVFFISLALPFAARIYSVSPEDGIAIAVLVIVLFSTGIEILLTSIRVRDFGLNMVDGSPKKEIKATYAGKLKFDLQAIAMGALIVAFPDSANPFCLVALTALALSLPLAALSIAHKSSQHPPESR